MPPHHARFMSIKTDLEKAIVKRSKAIESLRIELTKEETYLQALNDVLRMSLRDTGDKPKATLRPGSAIDKVRNTILEARRPLHVNEILERTGFTHKLNLVSSISHYMRRGVIFTRPAPNTYGLHELKDLEDSPNEKEQPVHNTPVAK